MKHSTTYIHYFNLHQKVSNLVREVSHGMDYSVLSKLQLVKTQEQEDHLWMLAGLRDKTRPVTFNEGEGDAVYEAAITILTEGEKKVNEWIQVQISRPDVLGLATELYNEYMYGIQELHKLGISFRCEAKVYPKF